MRVLLDECVPRPLKQRASLEFSFSGLKTAVATHVARHGIPTEGHGLEDLAASVQSAIVDTLRPRLDTVEYMLADGSLSDFPVWGDASDEFTLVPGRNQTESLKRRPKALYLGLAANFREQAAPDSWKQIVQLPPAQDPCAGDEAPPPFKVGVSLAHYTMRVR